MAVDIRGLDKVDVLHALWNKSRSCETSIRMSVWPGPKAFDRLAASVVVGVGEIDSFCAVLIKCDLRGDSFDPTHFDSYNGAGSAARAAALARR